MRAVPSASFDLAIVDPPYGLSSDADWAIGADHELKGFGGPWKLASHEWDKLTGIVGLRFSLAWLGEVRRLVKPTGSFWIHSTYHNSGVINIACQLLGVEIINEVVWYKRNAVPNLSCRRLTASHETLLWVHTGEHNRREYRFNYKDAKEASFPEDSHKSAGRQLRTVWDVPNNKGRDELRFGRHPTQKPLRLTERLFMVAGVHGGRVLVPFVGSGTEMIAALRYGMASVGYETDEAYYELASTRLADEVRNMSTGGGEG
ncbi:MAG: DNA-methyltransferase [Acidobacteriaceae bacterium]